MLCSHNQNDMCIYYDDPSSTMIPTEVSVNIGPLKTWSDPSELLSALRVALRPAGIDVIDMTSDGAIGFSHKWDAMPDNDEETMVFLSLDMAIGMVVDRIEDVPEKVATAVRQVFLAEQRKAALPYGWMPINALCLRCGAVKRVMGTRIACPRGCNGGRA